jgi:hypothetical protein
MVCDNIKIGLKNKLNTNEYMIFEFKEYKSLN